MSAAAIDEIEAKLLAEDERALRIISRLRAVGRFSIDPGETTRLRTTYLDTDDRRLLRRRIGLRVRQQLSDPPRWEMTAKWGGAVDKDVHSRRELTVELAMPEIPTSLPSGPLRDHLSDIVEEKPLVELVTTAIDRQTALVKNQHSEPVAELALDVVRHSSPQSAKQPAAYYEVEVERIGGGTRADVAEIARLLRREAPLTATSETKFSRALRDLYGLTIA